MIELKMPDSAAGIQKNRERVARSAANSNELHLLESQTRPNLAKFAYQASLYEKQEQALNATMV